MPMKPSILKGIETILGAKKVENFVNEAEDFLILEDSSGRIRISNTSSMTMRDFSSSHYVTGIISAVKGRLDEKGVFTMEDILFNKVSNYSLPKRLQLKDYKIEDGTIWDILQSQNNILAFVSGLNFGDTDYSGKSQLSRNLLIDFFQGRFTNDEMIYKLIKRINRLVIVGNSINSPDDTDLVEKGSFMKQDLNSRVMRMLLQNYDEFDEYLNILSNSVRIDVMPGSEDNSSSFFPQLPLNPIMFPNSSSNDSVNFVPNPYSFKQEDLLITGTSGQNIKNIQQYTKISDSTIDIMEKTLEWNHMSPSAPDTIRTFPITERDSLIIENVPNVYFTGNSKRFETRISHYNQNPVRLISIPEFYKNHSIVLLDLISLKVCEYKFEFHSS